MTSNRTVKDEDRSPDAKSARTGEIVEIIPPTVPFDPNQPNSLQLAADSLAERDPSQRGATDTLILNMWNGLSKQMTDMQTPNSVPVAGTFYWQGRLCSPGSGCRRCRCFVAVGFELARYPRAQACACFAPTSTHFGSASVRQFYLYRLATAVRSFRRLLTLAQD